MGAVLATIVAGRQTRIILNIEVDRKNINNYFILMNLFKSFNSNIGQYMRKAACPLGGMESSNPRPWRGKQLHHHGGGFLLVVCVVVDGLVMSQAHRM
jgi:hypothetical protein